MKLTSEQIEIIAKGMAKMDCKSIEKVFSAVKFENAKFTSDFNEVINELKLAESNHMGIDMIVSKGSDWYLITKKNIQENPLLGILGFQTSYYGFLDYDEALIPIFEGFLAANGTDGINTIDPIIRKAKFQEPFCAESKEIELYAELNKLKESNFFNNELKLFCDFIRGIQTIMTEANNDNDLKDCDAFDFRYDGNVYTIPTTLDEYILLWNELKHIFLDNYHSFGGDFDGAFLDLYANYNKENSAYFTDKVIQLTYDDKSNSTILTTFA